MSDIGQPIEVFLTPEERDTIVGALRFWQAIAKGEPTALEKLMKIPDLRGENFNSWGGLENVEVDDLCTRLNL